MKIFFGECFDRANVPADSPIEESLVGVLDIFRNLTVGRGFLCVCLNDHLVLQLLLGKKGVQIELLDSSVPFVDLAQGDAALAEELIMAAGNGGDVFRMARERIQKWEHLNL